MKTMLPYTYIIFILTSAVKGGRPVMKNMIKNLSKEIDSMNSISKMVIKYGFEIFLGMLFISLAISVLNNRLLGNIYEWANNSTYMFKTSFSMLAVAMVSGIIMDFIARKG